MLYFLLHDADEFHGSIVPALVRSLADRNFAPLAALADALESRIELFSKRYRLTADELPLILSARGMSFDRRMWKHLAGELFLYAATEVPEIPTAPAVLTCLLAPHRLGVSEPDREKLASIEQAHFGSRDVQLGQVSYRPFQAGMNDVADVANLSEYLAEIDMGRWQESQLAILPGFEDPVERAEELEMVRDWFPLLQSLYSRASEQRQVIICEEL